MMMMMMRVRELCIILLWMLWICNCDDDVDVECPRRMFLNVLIQGHVKCTIIIYVLVPI